MQIKRNLQINIIVIFNALVENVLKNKTCVIVSGLHGDEPAGNIAVQAFKNKENIFIFSNINKTNKRRYKGKDLNRHFDDNNRADISDKLLQKIEDINPYIVISLHEDNEVSGLYAYCSQEIEQIVQGCIKHAGFHLAKRAHSDKTDSGVITDGKQPYRGTLERALKKRGILYCTLETPLEAANINDRVECMKYVIGKLLKKIT